MFDPAARSGLMRSIKSKNTQPEVWVFREMRRRRIWFQPNYGRAPGSPDLARPRDRRAVFIDGDFWHGRELNRVVARYGADSEWAKKLKRNIERDREVDATLLADGWHVLRVWESDLRRLSTRDAVFEVIADFLGPSRLSAGLETVSRPVVRTFEPEETAGPKSRGPT